MKLVQIKGPEDGQFSQEVLIPQSLLTATLGLWELAPDGIQIQSLAKERNFFLVSEEIQSWISAWGWIAITVQGFWSFHLTLHLMKAVLPLLVAVQNILLLLHRNHVFVVRGFCFFSVWRFLCTKWTEVFTRKLPNPGAFCPLVTR